MNLLEYIQNIDKILVILIHNDMDHPTLDLIIPALRNPFIWIPLYIGILIWVARFFPNKLFQFILLTLITVALSDFISASILKPILHRIRPLHDPTISAYFRSLIQPGGLFSFPSSHASNHFAVAFLWNFLYQYECKKNAKWLYVWASIICYAQIYVGKHYPTDILAGALLVWIISVLTHRSSLLFSNLLKHRNKDPFLSFPA